VIEDEIVKTVTERRMEIEQRLNGEPVTIEKKYEPFARGDDVVQMTSKPTEMPAVEPIEPTEVSFEHKRMSFERGVSIEQVLQEDIPIKDKSVMLEEKKMTSIDEKPIDVDMDAIVVRARHTCQGNHSKKGGGYHHCSWTRKRINNGN
jgi:hypothetical protein